MKQIGWVLSVCLVMVALAVVAVGADTHADRQTPYSDLVPYTPAEMHQILADGKQKAIDRSLRLAKIFKAAEGQDDYNALYYKIEMFVDEVAEQIYGRVTMVGKAKIDGFDQPVLDLYDNMDIDSVFDHGVYTTNWTEGSNLITITLATPVNTDEEFEITVVYHGHPVEGGFQSFNFGYHNGTPIISTLSEPFLARTWWPCKDRPDDKADSVDIVIEVNKDFFVSSNGVLRDSVDNGATTTYWWHEGYPITTYLVSLAITDYEHFRRWYTYGPADADSTPVDFYPYPELLWTVMSPWTEAVAMIDFYAETFGEYPFVDEKYGMSHFTWSGAMEHQTNTSATSSSFGWDRYLIAHELSHQWWGDYITVEDWHHIWLNEGFASYCEALYAEHLGGWSDLHSYMSSMQYWYSGTIYVQDPSSVGAIFTSRVYDKGAWVLHMLRHILGDQDFFDGLRAYYSDPTFAHGHANTEQFRDVMASVSGRDLTAFFDDWIYGELYPQYSYSWMSEPGASGEFNIFLHISQVQSSSPSVFDLPIDIAVVSAGGVDTLQVYNDQRNQDYMLTVSSAPTSLILDPANWILDSHSASSYTFNLVNYTLADGSQFVAYAD